MKRWTRRPEGSTWGDFGPDDEISRLNLLTEEKVLQAVREVRAGKVFCLSLPLDLPGGNVLNPRRHPPALAPTRRDGQPYLNFQMSRLQEGAVDVLSDDQATLSLQYSTQWDGLSHVGALFDVQGDGQPGACTTTAMPPAWTCWAAAILAPMPAARPAPRMRAGSASAATRKKACRAVACCWTWRAPSAPVRTPVGLAQLQAAMHEQRVAVEPGDMLVLRTGFAEALVQMDGKPDAHRLEQTGAVLDGADAALLDWITDSGVAAICADNYAVEAYPARTSGPGHSILPLHHHCLFSWACRWPNSGT
ncbi:cyclase family protein [Achromobacter xylosoxidans]